MPFNQGSKQDVEALIGRWLLMGSTTSPNLPITSCLSTCCTVFKMKKASFQFVTQPLCHSCPIIVSLVMIPTVIVLETLFNRWNSESWGEHLCPACAVTGQVKTVDCHLNLDSSVFQVDAWQWSHEHHQYGRPGARDMVFAHPSQKRWPLISLVHSSSAFRKWTRSGQTPVEEWIFPTSLTP